MNPHHKKQNHPQYSRDRDRWLSGSSRPGWSTSKFQDNQGYLLFLCSMEKPLEPSTPKPKIETKAKSRTDFYKWRLISHHNSEAGNIQFKLNTVTVFLGLWPAPSKPKSSGYTLCLMELRDLFPKADTLSFRFSVSEPCSHLHVAFLFLTARDKQEDLTTPILKSRHLSCSNKLPAEILLWSDHGAQKLDFRDPDP